MIRVAPALGRVCAAFAAQLLLHMLQVGSMAPHSLALLGRAQGFNEGPCLLQNPCIPQLAAQSARLACCNSSQRASQACIMTHERASLVQGQCTPMQGCCKIRSGRRRLTWRKSTLVSPCSTPPGISFATRQQQDLGGRACQLAAATAPQGQATASSMQADKHAEPWTAAELGGQQGGCNMQAGLDYRGRAPPRWHSGRRRRRGWAGRWTGCTRGRRSICGKPPSHWRRWWCPAPAGHPASCRQVRA